MNAFEVVDLPLQNATKPDRKPCRQKLQWQRQHRSAFFSFGPAHGVPFSPSHALRKVADTFCNCRDSFRFSTILFWHLTGSMHRIRNSFRFSTILFWHKTGFPSLCDDRVLVPDGVSHHVGIDEEVVLECRYKPATIPR
jgi:hypothetical protein